MKEKVHGICHLMELKEKKYEKWNVPIQKNYWQVHFL